MLGSQVRTTLFFTFLRVYRKIVEDTGAEPVEAPLFDKLRERSSPTVLRYTPFLRWV
jgi:hypothetical protein